jgi:hypothetical protein
MTRNERNAMTTRRRLLVFGLLASLLALGAFWLLWPLWQPESASEISTENAARIRTGMTLAEVEAILGGPPRRVGNGGPPTIKALQDRLGLSHLRGAKLWRSNYAIIWVEFGTDERVIAFACAPVRYQNVSRLDTIRRWLGL